MAHAGDLVGLVAGAGLHEEAQRRRMRLGVALGDDLQAVGELMLTKLQRAPPAVAGPSVTTVKSPRRMLGQIGVDALARQRVDQPAHFVQRPHAAQVIPIAGDRAAARRARFLLHDQAALDAGLQPRRARRLECPSASRTSSASVTSSVSWARSALVPA